MKGLFVQIIFMLYSEIIMITSLKKPLCFEVLSEDRKANNCTVDDIYKKTGNSLQWKIEAIRFYKEFRNNNSNEVYTNITLIFPNQEDLGKLSLQYQKTSIWHITPQKTKRFPMVFELAFIPFPKRDIGLQKRHKEKWERRCNPDKPNNDCNKLLPSAIRLRTSESELKLSLTGETIDVIYVDLLSSTCQSLKCDEGSVNCPNSTFHISYHFLINSSNGLHFQGLNSNKFYCARVSSVHECCFKATETIELISSPVSNAVVRITISKDYRFIHIILPLTVLCWMLFAVKYFHDNRLFRCCRFDYDLRNNQNLLTDSQSNDVELNFINETPLIANSKIEILLLYPNEGDSFQNLLDSFKKFLELYAYKIWDPNDDETAELINENMWQWVQYMFNKDELRIILIETRRTKDLLSMDLKTLPYARYHNERLFYFAIDKIKQNQILSADYTRLFRIRFDIYPEKINFIVPLTSYKIPEHLADFIEAVLGLTPGVLSNENIVNQCPNEIKILNDSLEKYMV